MTEDGRRRIEGEAFGCERIKVKGARYREIGKGKEQKSEFRGQNSKLTINTCHLLLFTVHYSPFTDSTI